MTCRFDRRFVLVVDGRVRLVGSLSSCFAALSAGEAFVLRSMKGGAR